ncbi:MAG TPA: HAD-IIIA family hydrolase [archaeon]|nr:HAD-IIIA family hydrolase [archaeon]
MRAVFLDRDGVITRKSDYFSSFDQLNLEENVSEAIKILNKNFLVIVITNQPVVARGLCTEKDVENIHNKLNDFISKNGAHIDAFYFCPHHPEMHEDVPEHAKKYRIVCNCRKPGTELLERAKKDFDIDLKNSFFIGDSTVDIQTAENIGCTSFLVRTGHGGEDKKFPAEPSYTCDNILEAAKLIDQIKDMSAVILVGGRGERMRPLTDNLPKPMLPIKGKPILEHQINLLRKYGINNITLCGHYLFQKIIDYFGDGSDFSVKMTYIDEPEPLGTGGALKNAENKIKSKNFILMNGDIATNIHLSKLIQFHLEKNALATLVLRVSDHPRDSDVIEIDENCMVSNFVGKGQEETRTANTGIFAINKKFLEFIPKGISNLEKDVIAKMIGQPVFGFISDDYFKDIGTIERFNKAQEESPL